MRLSGIAILASLTIASCSLPAFPPGGTGGNRSTGGTTAGSGGATGGTGGRTAGSGGTTLNSGGATVSSGGATGGTGGRTAGSGGTTAGTGGSTSTAGATATGGRNGSGGFTGTGGTTVTYGGTAAGGFTSTAGTTVTSGGAGTGGSIGTGGTTVANGGTGTGGSTSTGGTTARDGGIGTGGSTSTGGTTTGDAGFGTGGFTGTGGTTGIGTGIDAEVGAESGPEPGPESSAEPSAEPGVEQAPEAPDAGADALSALPDSAFDMPPPPPPDLAPEAGPERPANLRIQRESDITRQVRLSWDYPSAVDIYIHNGDANGYYVESFSGATVVSGITGGTWLDTDAPLHQARYYRVRAVDSGQWAIDTAMKWDFGPFGGYRNSSFPAISANGENVLSKLVGAQMADVGECYRFDRATDAFQASLYAGSAWTVDLVFSILDGFYLYWPPISGTVTVTTVGLVGEDVSSIYVPAGEDIFWGTGYPVPVALSSIGCVSAGAHLGTNKDNADNIAIVYDVASSAWTGTCWLSTNGHWYWNADNSPCDSAQLLPGKGYWYQSRGTAFTFTIPKPYTNP